MPGVCAGQLQTHKEEYRSKEEQGRDGQSKSGQKNTQEQPPFPVQCALEHSAHFALPQPTQSCVLLLFSR